MTRGWRRVGLVGLGLLTAASGAPALGLAAALAVAGAAGCPVDENGAHPCRVGGLDLGGALHTAFVLGWLTLVTWPGLLVRLGAWAVLAVRRLRA